MIEKFLYVFLIYTIIGFGLIVWIETTVLEPKDRSTFARALGYAGMWPFILMIVLAVSLFGTKKDEEER